MLIKHLNRKGDIPSIIISLIVILFVVAIVALFFSKIMVAIMSEMKTMPEFSNNSKETMTLVETKTIPYLDYLFLFSFIAISIGIIISSIFIDTHPAASIIFIIALVIALVLAGLFANAYVEIAEDGELVSTYNQFVYTKYIINHFPLFVLVIGVITAIVLFSKSRGGGSGLGTV